MAIVNLKDILFNIKKWVEEWPEQRTDDMKGVVKLSISQGWYLNEVLLFGLYRDYEEGRNFSSFMEEIIESDWDAYWSCMMKQETSRQAIFNEAKACYEQGLYSAAIHLFFSQSDGIFYDKFGKSLYKKEGGIAQQEMGSHITDFIARDSIKELINQYKDGSVFRRMYNEAYAEAFSVIGADSMKNIQPTENEAGFVIPNRHGVLHGMHRNYGSKTNALKCFSMLLFVMYVIHGEDMLGSGI